jgi:hypothetical protein
LTSLLFCISDYVVGVEPPHELIMIRSAKAGTRRSSSHVFRVSEKLNLKTKVCRLFVFRLLLDYIREGTTVLIPLTNSLCVPGHLSDAEKVFIDVGTWCYVKKICVRSHAVVRY